MPTESLIIIWSWPAWHTAAVYAARANLQPLMFEWFLAGGVAAGGQLTTTTSVENFPGFPGGIQWPELMERMRAQSIENGTRILTQTVDKIELNTPIFKVWSEWKEYQARSIIISTGATAKRLDVPGAQQYRMKGISWCAICDGSLPMFRDQVIGVVGWWDVAAEEALHMSHFGSKVVMIVRSDKLRASKAMQQRLTDNPKIQILRNTQVTDILWDNKRVTSLNLINNQTQSTSKLDVGGLFFAIGHIPNTWFLDGQLELDETGYIITQPGSTQTSVAGVFAAGDVQDKIYRQAITSAGTGCMAALQAEKHLQS